MQVEIDLYIIVARDFYIYSLRKKVTRRKREREDGSRVRSKKCPPFYFSLPTACPL